MKKSSRIKFYNLFCKCHGLIGAGIGIFFLWMAIGGVILANREVIREMGSDFDSYSHSTYTLNFPEDSISPDAALKLGWKALDAQENYKRIELKWERGAPIYRIRFADKNKSEVTIHAGTGAILIDPSQKQEELKKTAQDLHVLSFLPENTRSVVFDALSVVVIIIVVSGMIMFFRGKKLSGTWTRKLHTISSVGVGIFFLIMAISGIMLNHEDWLEAQSKKYVTSTPTEKPALDFNYDLLPITSQKAVDIFQNQFSTPKILRRVLLTYSKECGTLIWTVEPNPGMRIATFIDAYTGEIIKSSNEIQFIEFIDQIHEWFLFGEFSKYLVDILAVLLVVCTVTGWLLTPQTLRRRVRAKSPAISPERQPELIEVLEG